MNAQAQKMQRETNFTNFPGVFPFPAKDQSGSEGEAITDAHPGWFRRRMLDLGVFTMANSSHNPPGFYVNWTTVTGLIALCVFLGGLFLWTWNTAYQQGQQESERQHLIQRLEKAEKDAEEAKKLQTYQAGAADFHGQNDNKKENK
jgi:hypothetical protein